MKLNKKNKQKRLNPIFTIVILTLIVMLMSLLFSLLGIEGRIQTRSYDNQQGVRVYVTEVITDSVQFLEPKSAGNSQPRNMQNANPYGSASSYSQPDYVDDAFGSFDSNDTLDIASDDLPF